MVELEGAGGSTHFIVDWDGALYQVLDLAWEAKHSQRAMRVPAEGGGVPRRALPEPDALEGVIGHLHISRRAQDPGAGFP